MRKVLPYLKLLKPVKGRFTLAIFAGIFYGLASGAGIPYISFKLFPLLFKSDPGITYAVKEKGLNLNHTVIGSLQSFPASGKLYYSSDTAKTPQLLPSESSLNIDGTINLREKNIPFQALYIKTANGSLSEIETKIYQRKSNGKFSEISGKKTTNNDYHLIWAVLLLPAVFAIRGVAGFINTYYITYCGQKVLEQIRNKVFHKMQRLDLAFFQKNGTGDLISRQMTEANRLQHMITFSANDLIKQPVTLIGALGALTYLAWQNQAAIFLLASLSVIPFCILPLRSFSKKMVKKMRKGAAREGTLGNCLQENIVGARDIRSFNLGDSEISKFQALQTKFYHALLGVTRYSAMITPSVEIISALGISLAMYFSVKQGMTLETFLPLLSALYMTYEPIKKLATLQSKISLGTVAIDRLEYILHADETILSPENPKPLPELKGGIRFDNVSFQYDSGNPVLDHIHTTIQPGEVVALVGPSGAGKSTFTHLISRSYEITKGRIFFDDHNVVEHSLTDLRSQVSVVSQDPYLFNDTIKNNIRLGKLDASDKEIFEAAERASCAEFIKELPDGYETIVGEKATRLSGGQKQRLAIARAFLKDSPILILDEATSALDAESEQAVQSALSELVAGRTTLIIAHRFSSIQIATRVLVFDKGEIVADGNHESLMQDSPLYKDLYLKQNI